MSEVKVNKITPTANCGTVTLGDSGDTFSLPAGVTLSNAGSITNSGTITNTGTISGGTITGNIDGQVSWDTTAKTAGFTAVAGNGYFVNTTSGAITVTLPATPTAGDFVGIKDYANTADTNNITIDRNGSNIQGTANNFIISTEGLSIILIYVDGTQGWVSTGAAQASDISEGPTYIVATGGTVSCCGDYKIHTFTGPGTFTVCSVGNPLGSTTVDYLVVAGGGSGGNGFINNNCGAGGGGAGGFRESVPSPAAWSASPLANPGGALPVTATGYPITVGGGGAAAGPGNCSPSNSGSPSTFSTITSTGGGRGANASPSTIGNPNEAAFPGGSGGGGARTCGTAGGTGNSPPVSPPQGQPGGTGSPGAGGGGATAAGTGGVDCSSVGNGGAGATTSISGSPTSYAGGGGAGHTAGETGGGTGGTGGGGDGGDHFPTGPGPTQGQAGTANTGGGGGAQGSANSSGSTTSGAGGSGVVIIRYKYK